MSLTTYNLIWNLLELILPNYLERRKKVVKKIFIEYMKDTEFQKKIDPLEH